MWKSQPHEALRLKKLFQLSYDGYSRVVEVHAVGSTKDGNAVMRVWQVRGGSNSGETQGWKLLQLDEAIGGHMLYEASQARRAGYRRGDNAMAIIYCQV